MHLQPTEDLRLITCHVPLDSVTLNLTLTFTFGPSRAFLALRVVGSQAGNPKSGPMVCYAYIVCAFSPRDGGWVRHDTLSSETLGWQYIELFWEMLASTGDYVTLDVKKTIAF